MRILGIDCGSQITGFGVIESDGVSHALIEAGAVRTDSRQALPARLLHIGEQLRAVIARHHPDCAAVEDTFTSVNARSALKLSQVRGAVLFVLAEAGLEVGEYSPATVKGSVVGHGRAEKEQVAFMVRSLLRLDRELRPLDASDAVAVAVCHAVHQPRRAA
ncbi:MAG: crossover junction endodeoxyribonuclease RuvC [Bryobacteraceae bacterium]|nr:crossover junction endodeoxyribonuclease RuvC [Bryobacteraceae bacterium]